MKQPRLIKYILVLLFSAGFLNSNAQKGDTTVYTDYSIPGLTPAGPTSINRLDSGARYIRIGTGSKKDKVVIGKVYSYGSKVTRKAKWVNTKYGRVLAFKLLISPGYECVVIFCDKDHSYDSLLVVKDTLFFKEMDDDVVELSVVYPAGTDTLVVRKGRRNTRHDFLKKIFYNPAMKNHARWFLQNMLDTDVTYVLVKKGNGYEIAASTADWSGMSAYDKERIQHRFRTAGPSAFWVALMDLYFY